MGIKTAKLIVTAEDKLSAPMKRMAGEMNRFAALITRLNAASSWTKSLAGLSSLTAAMQRAEGAAKRLERATNVAGQTRNLAAQGRAIEGLSRAYERASNQAQRLKAAGAVRLRVDTGNLKAAEDRMKRMLDMQNRLGRGGSGNAPPRTPGFTAPGYGRPSGSIGQPYTSGQGRGFAREGFDQAASVPQVQALMRMRGENEGNITRATDQAVRLSKEVSQFSIAEHLQGIYQSLSVFGDMEKALENYPRMSRMNALVEGLQDRFQGLKPYAGGTLTKDLARIFDSLGVTEDPRRMNSIGEAVIKGITASSGDITPSDYLMALKYARIGKYGYSEDFIQNYMPGIIGDAKTRTGGASSAGTGLASMSDQFADLRATDAAKRQMEQLGLIEGNFERSPKGKIIGRGSANVRDVETLRANPQKWAVETLLPLIESRYGKLTGDSETDARTVSEAIGKITSNRVAKDMLAGMILQRDERERDAKIARGMPGLSALDVLNRDAPVTALQSLTAASKDFLGAVAGPMVGPAVDGMKAIAEQIRNFTTWAHENPQAGAAAGAAITAGATATTGAAAWKAHQWWRGKPPTAGPTLPPGAPPGTPPASQFAPGGPQAAARGASRIPSFALIGGALAVGAVAAAVNHIGDANRKLHAGRDPTQPHYEGRNRRRAFHDKLREESRSLREGVADSDPGATLRPSEQVDRLKTGAKVDAAPIEDLKDKMDEARRAAEQVNGTTVKPAADPSELIEMKRHLDDIQGKIDRINGGVGGMRRNLSGLPSAVPSGGSDQGRADMMRATRALERSRETNLQDRPFFG